MPEIIEFIGKIVEDSHPMVDIILPVYKHLELTEKCLKSLEENENNYHVIVIDNSADNVGVVKAENLGIKQSKNDYILIVGNDTTFSPNFLSNMFVPMKEDERVKVVGSLFEHSTNYQTPSHFGEFLKGKKWILVPMGDSVNFSCTLIDKKMFDKFGLLDENFFLGFGADDDFCRRVFRGGHRLAINMQNIIYHEGRVTLKEIPNWEDIAKKEKEYYFKKWNIQRLAR
ncbi:MAG: glycosyltransferase [Nanoarchaeota archaeon]